MSRDLTTLQISIALNSRLKKLAEGRAAKLGITKTLSRSTYLEMLVSEEEERSHAAELHQ